MIASLQNLITGFSDIFDFPYALQVEQHKVINTTQKIAKEYDTFEPVCPCEVIGHVQDESVTLSKNEGEIETHRGLLLGTDGGRSVTRKDAASIFLVLRGRTDL